ncbi:hypothetical protein B0H11DRAFT_2025105 [Mycena galericulata]|nr:hypothetical protein B0H11DRAFT_2128846 [Mycena galericulata]KAJ7442105.1 hypothetical protein B0H11DRAFT_2095042 [Mycena galericulata]KAJ7480490.1 hypothetical protein B0H11DRAFT_2025105 [Mycena galericulata]
MSRICVSYLRLSLRCVRAFALETPQEARSTRTGTVSGKPRLDHVLLTTTGKANTNKQLCGCHSRSVCGPDDR